MAGLFSFGLFSHDGPTRVQISETRFAMTFYCRGYSANAARRLQVADRTTTSSVSVDRTDAVCAVRVAGGEPGYDATVS